LRGQQLLERYINWPRISVVTRQSGYFHVNFRGSVEQEPLKDKVHIVVVNSGSEAASIANEGLWSADNTIRTDVETQRAAVAYSRLPPDIPTRSGGGSLPPLSVARCRYCGQ
jgi:hypothetical protein